ncbi:MAG: hypothetical protein ACKVIS_24780, partial [Pseudomonadales bacterium]
CLRRAGSVMPSTWAASLTVRFMVRASGCVEGGFNVQGSDRIKASRGAADQVCSASLGGYQCIAAISLPRVVHCDRCAALQMASTAYPHQVAQRGFVLLAESEGLALWGWWCTNCTCFGCVGGAVGDGLNLLTKVLSVGWVASLQAHCVAGLLKRNEHSQLVGLVFEVELNAQPLSSVL